MKLRAILSGLAVVSLAFGGVLVTAAPASAASFIVHTADDGNSGMTLRAAGFARVIHSTIDIGAVEAPASLAATGSSVPLWLPIGGGVLLVLGIAGVVIGRLRRRAPRP
jgi:LPXTG-motif cell wall-anchored protein